MVPLSSLLIPILAAAVLAFVASFVFHMLLPFHHKDWLGLPNEDAARKAIGPLGIPPGDYMLPHGGGPEAMKDPAFIEKMTKGPIVIMTVLPNAPPSMGNALWQWFIYCVVVMLFNYLGYHSLWVDAAIWVSLAITVASAIDYGWRMAKIINQ